MAQLNVILEELGVAPLWTRRDIAIASGFVDTAHHPKPPCVDAGEVDARSARTQVVDPLDTQPLAGGRAEPLVRPAASANVAQADVPAAVAADPPVLPEAAPVPGLDWAALKQRVAGCTLCRLCERRTNTVFGVGDEAADWMLIGEAPGENEDRQGEPFVGQAGKLLDNMLCALQLRRGANVYIANVLKCRPPGNRNPEPDEVLRCEPYLKRQVELVRPRIIVALGRFAAQALLKTDASISSLRGRAHKYEDVPVIVTYHPAYLLRRLQDKHKTWSDLCLARAIYRQSVADH